MKSYTARELWSMRQNDGLLATTAFVAPEAVADDELRAAWPLVRELALSLKADLARVSALMKDHPEDPGSRALKRGIAAEGSLTYLLVYYGFDSSVCEDEDLYSAVEDVLDVTADYRLAEHHLEGLLGRLADDARPQTQAEALEALHIRES